jgi:hypothetical protein
MTLRCNVGRLRHLYLTKYGEPAPHSTQTIKALWRMFRPPSSTDHDLENLTIATLTRMRYPTTLTGRGPTKRLALYRNPRRTV